MKKKIKYILVVLVAMLCNLESFAYDIEENGLLFDYIGYRTGYTYGEAHLVGYNNISENLIVPTTVQYKKGIQRRNCEVTTIASGALKNSEIKSVSTYADISSSAFENCTSLHSITIFGKFIASKAFCGCIALDSIY